MAGAMLTATVALLCLLAPRQQRAEYYELTVIFYCTTPNTDVQSLLVFTVLPRCYVVDVGRTFQRCQRSGRSFVECTRYLAYTIRLADTSDSRVQSTQASTVSTHKVWLGVVTRCPINLHCLHAARTRCGACFMVGGSNKLPNQPTLPACSKD